MALEGKGSIVFTLAPNSLDRKGNNSKSKLKKSLLANKTKESAMLFAMRGLLPIVL